MGKATLESDSGIWCITLQRTYTKNGIKMITWRIKWGIEDVKR